MVHVGTALHVSCIVSSVCRPWTVYGLKVDVEQSQFRIWGTQQSRARVCDLCAIDFRWPIKRDISCIAHGGGGAHFVLTRRYDSRFWIEFSFEIRSGNTVNASIVIAKVSISHRDRVSRFYRSMPEVMLSQETYPKLIRIARRNPLYSWVSRASRVSIQTFTWLVAWWTPSLNSEWNKIQNGGFHGAWRLKQRRAYSSRVKLCIESPPSPQQTQLDDLCEKTCIRIYVPCRVWRWRTVPIGSSIVAGVDTGTLNADAVCIAIPKMYY